MRRKSSLLRDACQQPGRDRGVREALDSGRGVMTERIKLAADGDAFTSTITYEMLDPQGKPAAGGGKASGRAVRIRR